MSTIGTPYTIHEIADAVSAKDLFQGHTEQPPLLFLSFDTRYIQNGEQTLFIALRTPNRDGHDFIREAFEKGVKNFMVDKKNNLIAGINYVLVEDTLDALQLWAGFHRNRFRYPVIGITGSNGKTTVKEWLTTLIESAFQVIKSPMSYNSQLGVPISLLQMNPEAEVAIIEAGISQKGEMERLQRIIQPTFGILTHIGTAHADGFASFEEKISEKLILFRNVTHWVYSGEQADVNQMIKKSNLPPVLTFKAYIEKNGRFPLDTLDLAPFSHTQADRENAALCILMSRLLGINIEVLKERLPLLYPIQMRTEMITDNPEITVINDSYNSDPDSVINAMEVLKNTLAHPHKRLILTDMLNQGKLSVQQHTRILTIAETLFGKENVYTIGDTFSQIRQESQEVVKKAFQNMEQFMEMFRYEAFKNSTVLLKGARQFGLEKLIPLLNHKPNASVFKVNLNALIHNVRFFRSQIPKHTHLMCMVKAFSYGSGTWEIAEVLEKEGVDYLGVAYVSEGIELKSKGIKLPIMVMNPDTESIEALIYFGLEPEIYQFGLLDRYIRAARLAGLNRFPVHLKFDTGMGRLGFSEKDLPQIVDYLIRFPDLQVVSIMTHLAAADEPEARDFTLHQLRIFTGICEKFTALTGISPLRHALNSAGILNYPEYALEMVRLGIGLYGINPVNTPQVLQEIGTLVTVISQIHEYPAGTSIGYGRAQFTNRNSRIATIPIGYADGIFRSLSNGKLSMYVREKLAPIFGRICMDMMMLDVTDIPDTKEGDEVLIFGYSGNIFRSVADLAAAAGTIPYEILTSISPRVRRVYVRE